jgi:hypothetical protein
MNINRVESVSPSGDVETLYEAKPESGAAAPVTEDANGSNQNAWPTALPCEAFYGPAGQFVRAVAPFTEADPAGILISTLVLFGNAAGRSKFLRTGADVQTPNINAILAGSSGSGGRKGTATSTARYLFKLCGAFTSWDQNCLQLGLSSGEGLVWAVRDPIYRRAAKKDGHVEVILDDQGIEDKRVVFIETEFSSVLKVAAREGNTLSGVIRQAFDSGDLRLCTKNNPAKATGAHVSLIGHVTPPELLRFMSTTEMGNGFANRFLWACVRRSKYLPNGESIPERLLRPIAQKFENALSFASTAGEVRRDEAANSMWCNVYPELTAERVGLLGAIVGRAEVLVLRLSMIYALLDCSPVIQPPHLEAAIAVWEYCEASVKYIFGDSIGDPDADTILSALRRAPEGLDRSQISGLFARNRTASTIDRALGVLLKANLAVHFEEKTSGRSREVWRPRLIS